jgi:hypothetical protein
VQAPPLYRLVRIAEALHVESAELFPRPQGVGHASDLPDYLADAVASVASAAEGMREVDTMGRLLPAPAEVVVGLVR